MYRQGHFALGERPGAVQRPVDFVAPVFHQRLLFGNQTGVVDAGRHTRAREVGAKGFAAGWIAQDGKQMPD
jgi:hypothetical protein